MKKVGEGAEASIYVTYLLGVEAIVKRREEKRYRAPALDMLIRSQRTKKEAKMLAMASSLIGNVPKLLLAKRHEIYMSKVEGTRLSLIIDKLSAKALRNYAEKSGEYLAVLHDANIVHGDYTPANLIANSKTLYVIDFGLSEMTNALEDKAIDLLVMKRAIGKQLFSNFTKGYSKRSQNAIGVLSRLSVVEKRGRYQTRTLESINLSTS